MSTYKLNYEQNIAAHHIDGPMLVLAGPGSGKTHLLVERIRIMIEEENVNPENILVITFSQKSALEMKNRFFCRVNNKPYPVRFGTFHAAFFGILKSFYHYSNDCILTDFQKFETVKNLAEKGKCYKVDSVDDELINELVNYISAYKNFGDAFFEKSFGKYMSYEEKDDFLDLYNNYSEVCRKRGKIDFDDMVLMVRELFVKHEYELRKWQNIYKYFLVDEFQDINEAQYDVLRLLAGDAKNVFAVGDDDQSIYAFRGAKPSLMQKFITEFHGCKRVNLSMNYRCSSNIIKCSDNVITNNIDRLSRPMQKNLPEKDGGDTGVFYFENTVTQAKFVCDLIKRTIRKKECMYEDIAVLYRSEHCATMLKNSLKQEGIPIRKYEESFNPYDTYFAEIVLAYLKAALGCCGRKEFLLVLNNPPRNLSREAVCNICTNKTEDYFNLLRRYYEGDTEHETTIMDLKSYLEKIRDLSAGYAVLSISHIVYEKNMDLPQDLKRTVGFLNEISSDFKSIDEFASFLEKKRTCDSLNRVNHEILKSHETRGVNLLTAHASKGLEFKMVIIIGLQEGLFPHHKSLSGELIEEERRLMYVAMTRAKEKLVLCALGTGHGKRVSRFVGESLIIN